jgi:hypothetical protein
VTDLFYGPILRKIILDVELNRIEETSAGICTRQIQGINRDTMFWSNSSRTDFCAFVIMDMR